MTIEFSNSILYHRKNKKTFISLRNCDNFIERNLAIHSSFILFYFFVSNGEEISFFFFVAKMHI